MEMAAHFRLLFGLCGVDLGKTSEDNLVVLSLEFDQRGVVDNKKELITEGRTDNDPKLDNSSS
jgi:hypothetical protein